MLEVRDQISDIAHVGLIFQVCQYMNHHLIPKTKAFRRCELGTSWVLAQCQPPGTIIPEVIGLTILRGWARGIRPQSALAQI